MFTETIIWYRQRIVGGNIAIQCFIKVFHYAKRWDLGIFEKKIKSVLRLLAKNSGLEVEMIEMSPLVCFLNNFFREIFFLVNDIQNVPEGKAWI